MTAPRKVDPNTPFYVTVRATNRCFRFVPKPKVRESIKYVLAVVLARYRRERKLVLHEWCFMSNHYHLLGFDIKGCIPDFVRDVNALLSRQLNALRGIEGSNIEKGYGLVTVHTPDRLLEHAVYTLANPVSAFLVARACQWPGATSVSMEYGTPVNVARPTFGLWADAPKHPGRKASKRSKRAKYACRTKFPDVAQLVISRPNVRRELNDKQLRALVRTQLREREEAVAEQRRAGRIALVGRKRILSAHFMAMPGSEELFARNPTFSASTTAERISLARVRQVFLDAYRVARDLFVGGYREAVFPAGTWLFKQRFGVACCPLPVA